MWTQVVLGDELDDAVGELTGGCGVDMVFDPVSGDLRTRAYALLAPFGRLVLLGNVSRQDRMVSYPAGAAVC